MNEIKNCPFCGNVAVKSPYKSQNNTDIVFCNNVSCAIYLFGILPERWNTRYADTELVEAASALIERMEAVYNMIEYQSVWTSYANHGGDYEHGPKWVDEFETLKITLKNHEQRSEGL